MILWLLACENEPTATGPVALVDVAAWAPADSVDPFADERPDGATCDGGTELEGGTLEVDTGVCAWLWVEQPLLAPVAEGDPLELVFWHSWLDAPEPAEGHLAVVIDGEVAHELLVPIPGEPASYTERFASPATARAGAPVGLHLHNHGTNTWNVLRLDRLPTEAP